MYLWQYSSHLNCWYWILGALLSLLLLTLSFVGRLRVSGTTAGEANFQGAWSSPTLTECRVILSKIGLCKMQIIQGVLLATEPGISLIILTPMKLLQRNLNRSTLVVWEMKRNVSSSTCYDVVTVLTQWGKSTSNVIAISSLVVKLLKKCRVR